MKAYSSRELLLRMLCAFGGGAVLLVLILYTLHWWVPGGRIALPYHGWTGVLMAGGSWCTVVGAAAYARLHRLVLTSWLLCATLALLLSALPVSAFFGSMPLLHTGVKLSAFGFAFALFSLLHPAARPHKFFAFGLLLFGIAALLLYARDDLHNFMRRAFEFRDPRYYITRYAGLPLLTGALLLSLALLPELRREYRHALAEALLRRRVASIIAAVAAGASFAYAVQLLGGVDEFVTGSVAVLALMAELLTAVLVYYALRHRLHDRVSALFLALHYAVMPVAVMSSWEVFGGYRTQGTRYYVTEALWNGSTLLLLLLGLALLRPRSGLPGALRLSGVFLVLAVLLVRAAEWIAMVPFTVEPEWVWVAGAATYSLALILWAAVLLRLPAPSAGEA